MNYKDKTDDELVEEAKKPNVLNRDRAQVEMMRRLKDSIDNMSKKTEFYSNVMVVLTLVLFSVALMQLLVSIELMESKWLLLFLSPLVLLSVLGITRDLKKEKDKIENNK